MQTSVSPGQKFGLFKNRNLVTLNSQAMKKNKHTESQIIKAINERESSRENEYICCEIGIRKSTFYNWKKQYSGMDNLQLKKLKDYNYNRPHEALGETTSAKIEEQFSKE